MRGCAKSTVWFMDEVKVLAPLVRCFHSVTANRYKWWIESLFEN